VALIRCPECTQSVSSLAATCPHCGVTLGRPTIPSDTPAAAGEETLWEGRPSVRLLAGQIAGTILSLVVIVPATFLAHAALLRVAQSASRSVKDFILGNDTAITLGLVVLGVVLLLPSLIALLRGLMDVKSLRYRFTNQRILVEKGLFAKTVQEIDLRYVDETQFSQGLLQRLLGIGSIRVVSTDAMTPRLVLSGIRDPRSVREILRTAAYAVSQRQFFTRST
jgi:hypothetical protein